MPNPMRRGEEAFAVTRTCAYLIGLCCICSSYLPASEVYGRITLQKSANKKTLAPMVYDLRGPAMSEHQPDGESTNQFGRVAVWLESSRPEQISQVTKTMAQKNRHFEPELLIIPAGSDVQFPNADPIFHNIFSLSPTRPFDLGYYPKGESRTVRFSRPGIVQVYCHVHPNMYGAIVVVSSRWFGKPSSDGIFSWADVAPGKYRLMVWQKFDGLIHRNIIVPESGRITVNIAIPDEDPDGNE